MKRTAWLLVFLFAALVAALPAAAGELSEAEKVLKTSVDQVVTVLSDDKMPQDQKRSKVVEIINTSFDFKLMAKLSLGKKQWTRLDAKQKEAFTQIFIKRFEDSYTDKLELFDNEKVIFQPMIAKKKKVQIPTFILSKGEKISMLYKMYKSKSGWKVYDVEIEGVSLIQTYRSQYHQILAQGTIEDLITKMKQKELQTNPN